MLTCKHITYNLGRYNIVKDLSFELESGTTVGFLGPNGAGKTTSLKMLCGGLRPSSGEVLLEDSPIAGSKKQTGSAIGFMPESPPLYPELRVREYVELFARLRRLESIHVKSKVAHVIEKCRLEEVSHLPCRALSKGFRQKVSLAAALVGEPKLLLLDEPTSGLDPREIVEIRKLIYSLKKDHTIIVSSHLLSEVEELCDSVLMIVAGRVVFHKTLEEINAESSLESAFLTALGGEEKC